MLLGRVVKQSAERFPITVDFALRLAGGDAVQSAVVTARNREDDADTSGTILQGSPQIMTPYVTITTIGGVHGEEHIVTFRATTTADYILEEDVLLMIRDE